MVSRPCLQSSSAKRPSPDPREASRLSFHEGDRERAAKPSQGSAGWSEQRWTRRREEIRHQNWSLLNWTPPKTRARAPWSSSALQIDVQLRQSEVSGSRARSIRWTTETTGRPMSDRSGSTTPRRDPKPADPVGQLLHLLVRSMSRSL